MCAVKAPLRSQNRLALLTLRPQKPAPMSYCGVCSQEGEETRDESSDTAGEVHKTLWLKKDCFQLVINNPNLETEEGV